jgi:maltose alpha-D-glucosyltransferase / alpha-amylase
LLVSTFAEEGEAEEAIAGMAERLHLLGQRVAELHVALAQSSGQPAFEPEALQAADMARWAAAVQTECAQTLQLLEQRRSDLPAGLDETSAQVLASAAALRAQIEAAAAGPVPVHLKTRLHGDLHLGQILIRRDDFLIIDFEGEPQRGFDERRHKHSALRDVAGLLRSFDYARQTALNAVLQNPADLPRLGTLARQWERGVRAAFLAGYVQRAVAGGLYADATAFESTASLLSLFELEKALYELRYELDNRPDWAGVPLAGIAELVTAADVPGA